MYIQLTITTWAHTGICSGGGGDDTAPLEP